MPFPRIETIRDRLLLAKTAFLARHKEALSPETPRRRLIELAVEALQQEFLSWSVDITNDARDEERAVIHEPVLRRQLALVVFGFSDRAGLGTRARSGGSSAANYPFVIAIHFQIQGRPSLLFYVAKRTRSKTEANQSLQPTGPSARG